MLFLEQDSVLPPELVDGLLAHLDEPGIGVVGPNRSTQPPAAATSARPIGMLPTTGRA